MLATSGRVNPDEYTDGFQHVLAPANNARHQREVDPAWGVQILMQFLIQVLRLQSCSPPAATGGNYVFLRPCGPDPCTPPPVLQSSVYSASST